MGDTSGNGDGPCERLSDFDSVGGFGLLTLLLGGVQICEFVGMGLRQLQLRWKARHGGHVTGLLINTSYLHFQGFFALSLLFLAITAMIWERFPAVHLSLLATIFCSISYGFYHATFNAIGLFLAQKGCGRNSIRMAILGGAFWGCIVIVIQGVAFRAHIWAHSHSMAWAVCLLVGVELLPALCYMLLAFTPISWTEPLGIERRPGIIFFSRFWALYLPTVAVALALSANSIDAGYCINIFGNWLIFGLIKPVAVYVSLRRDSDYWQGLINEDGDEYESLDSVSISQKRGGAGGEGSLHSTVVDVRTPLLGSNLEPPVAGTLSAIMDELHQSCKVIPFTCLKLGDGESAFGPSALMGAGSFGRVYRGKLRGKAAGEEDVAVKIIISPQMDRETILNFRRESAFLSSIRHPNIIHVEGVCVAPPSICLVMELCRGNLFEFLRTPTAHNMPWDARLCLAIDCASAVACLHNLQPHPIMHRDLKSSNFLLGESKVPKWTERDIKLWLETENLRVFINGLTQVGNPARKRFKTGILDLTENDVRLLVGSRLTHHPDFDRLMKKISELQTSEHRLVLPGSHVKLADMELSSSMPKDKKEAQASDNANTLNWTAPEVVRYGMAAFTLKSDCYSLGMVLWELLTGRVPFDEPGIGPAQLRALIVKNKVPQIPAETPEEYADLLRETWQEDPAKRPTARDIQERLTEMRNNFEANRTSDINFKTPDVSMVEPSIDDLRLVRQGSDAVERPAFTAASAYALGRSSKSQTEPRKKRERSHRRSVSLGNGSLDRLVLEDRSPVLEDRSPENDDDAMLMLPESQSPAGSSLLKASNC
eukprot:m.184243 g.184243  ORF g.184243 m.184243 type:complete len:825 (-) comp17484_c2_seq6:583-3057(-)